MDTTIPRHLVTRHLLIDSAFRSRRDPPHNYIARIQSLNGESAERLKDVVGIDVVSAQLPRMQQNVLPSLNVFDVHVVGTAGALTQSITSVSSLRTYLESNFACTCSGVLRQHKTLSHDGEVIGDVRYSALVTLRPLGTPSDNAFLCQADAFPHWDSEEHAGDSTTLHSVLVRQEGVESVPIWLDGDTIDADFQTPFVLRLLPTETHAVHLEPGYYASDHLLLNELLQGFSYIDGLSAEPALNSYGDWETSDAPGWSVRREPKGRWTLYFRTAATGYTDLFLSKRYSQYGFDMLSQLGLHHSLTQISWTERSSASRANRQAFRMLEYAMDEAHEDERVETIPLNLGATTTMTRLFVLNFHTINLLPRRYVDITIEQLPLVATKLTNHSTAAARVIARIDLTANHATTYSGSLNSSSSVIDALVEGVRTEAYAHYTTTKLQHTITTFEPITLRGLRIRLIDNLGLPYDSEREHSIELRVQMLGDAISPSTQEFRDYPSSSSSELPVHQRAPLPSFPEYEASARRGLRRREATERRARRLEMLDASAPDAPLHPVLTWAVDNALPITGTVMTFAGTWWLVNRVRAIFVQSPPPE